MPFRIDPLVDRLERVLDLRSQQHTLTSSNIANAETPEYKARFIAFDEALADAMGQGTGMKLSTAAPGHLAMAGGAENPEVVTVDPPPFSEDGNSVVLERETARLVSNQIVYSGVARGLSKHLSLLRFAASDGRS